MRFVRKYDATPAAKAVSSMSTIHTGDQYNPMATHTGRQTSQLNGLKFRRRLRAIPLMWMNQNESRKDVRIIFIMRTL